MLLATFEFKFIKGISITINILSILASSINIFIYLILLKNFNL